MSDQREIKRFVFELWDEGEEGDTYIYQFSLDGVTEDYQFTDEFEEMCDCMAEAYGIHDVCSPTLGEDDDAISYTSYEVEHEKYRELVENWRQFFASKGFTVGDIEGPHIIPAESGEE